MKAQQPNYAFSPSLLDAFQRMVDTKAEDYFYQDETGAWHLNWSDAEETLHFSEEEVDELLKKEFIDTVNKVPRPPSESADKGTAFNEIVDCLVKNSRPTRKDMVIKTVRSANDLCVARVENLYLSNGDPSEEEIKAVSGDDFAKIGVPFVFAGIDGFEFFFDKDFCMEASEYFKGSICQYYTKANLETKRGVVELHGYIDYLRMAKVYDAKTTKRYTFGDFQKRWQRYTYPFTLIESGMMNGVESFEYTVYLLKGGSGRTPLITGTQYKEVYTYDHEQARTMLTQQCERLIDFLEENRSLITNMKVFGITEENGISDNR